MKQTLFQLVGEQRVLSTVRALSLRAEHVNSAKDPAVSGAKDERARYQSWEEREHCLEASGHVTKQRVNKEQTDLTVELWFTLLLESAKLVGKVAYMISFLLGLSYFHF